MKLGIVIATLIFGTMGFAAQWAPPKSISVVKACGTLKRQKTQYDGVQPVFSERDARGNVLATTFLAPQSTQLEKQLESVEMDRALAVCVVGLPSHARKIDSPPDFLTFEVLF